MRATRPSSLNICRHSTATHILIGTPPWPESVERWGALLTRAKPSTEGWIARAACSSLASKGARGAQILGRTIVNVLRQVLTAVVFGALATACSKQQGAPTPAPSSAAPATEEKVLN